MQHKASPAARGGADLGNDSIGGLLFKLALPAIVAQLINVLYNMVDRMYIGHLPEIGETALTGVGVCFPLITAISAFAALVSMGGAPRASIFLGRGDKEMAERILGNCATALVAVGLILTVVFYLFGYQLLQLFGASPETIGYSWEYFRLYLVGTIFVQVSLGLNAFINAQGYALVGMLTVIIGAVLNIILDPVFMFGLGMGVSGAALATILSQAVSAAFTVWFLCSRHTYLRLKVKNFRPVAKTLVPSLVLGLSPFVMQLTESVIQISFNTQLQLYGGDVAVGAMTILSSVMQFCMLPLQGLTQGAQPISSFNFGAGKIDRIWQGVKSATLIGAVYSVLAFAALFSLGGVIPLLFVDADETVVIHQAHMFLTFNSMFYIPLTVVNVWRFTIQGMGYSFLAIAAGVCEMVGRAFVGFVLVPILGYVIICFASPIAWIMADLFLIPAFFYCMKRMKKLLNLS